MWSGNTYSMELNKCYNETQNGIKEEEKFDKRITKKNYFNIGNKKISYVKVFTDNAYKKKISTIREDLRSRVKQYQTQIFNIYYRDKSIIKAKRYEPILRSDIELVIDLETKQISKILVPGTKHEEVWIYNCKFNTSNILDYWWAVILIIAITFFIFTQSGKRLKKIRRK